MTYREEYERDSASRRANRLARIKALEDLQRRTRTWDDGRGLLCVLLVVVWIAIGWRTLSAKSLVELAGAVVLLRLIVGHFRERWMARQMAELDAKHPKPKPLL